VIPTPLDQLGSTPFSFYPPIVNIEHNEWIFRRSTWDEIQVVNTKTAAELWVPRSFVGELSLVGEPVMIVGLLKELEYRQGVVYPHIRRVIEMPRVVNDSPRTRIRAPEPVRPAAVVGIRLESRGRGKTVLGAVAAGLLACLVAVISRDVLLTSRAWPASARVQLPFTNQDDYDSIVRRLGPPAEDGWRTSKGVDYRRLWYPKQAFAVILIGGRYRGAIDSNGRVLHSVGPAAFLRSLP
jgi:hypothetical protein